MNLESRIDALIQLGKNLTLDSTKIQALFLKSYQENPWFTIKNQEKMVQGIIIQYLQKEALENYVAKYEMTEVSKRVGLILAGNIPMVGFHDIISTFLAGHISIIKLSDKDKYLIPFMVQELSSINEECKPYFEFIDKLENFEAVIATGSNNTAMHFEYYFKKYPRLIRRNRTAVAVITGEETDEDLQNLGSDIFSYFGLGCRNVSKIYCIGKFNKDRFYENLTDFKEIIHHNKYKNNYDYNYAIYLLNKMPFFTDNVLIAKPDESLHSRIASIHYEEIETMESVHESLHLFDEQIQTVVSLEPIFKRHSLFGAAQSPAIDTFADGVDTMTFLTKLT